MAETSQAASALTQANAQKDSRPVYEVGFHLVPTLEEGEISGVVNSIKSAIEKGGSEIVSEQFPAKMMLAYTIERAAAGKREKFAESYFGFIKFVTDRENIPAVEATLRSTRAIIRHLLIETVREDAAPRRAIYTSTRLEGETIKKPTTDTEEPKGPVSEEELEKSIEAITQ